MATDNNVLNTSISLDLGVSNRYPSALDAGLPGANSRSSSSNPTVYYQAGNDLISLGDGNNTIYAGEGNNVVSTGFGRDSIFAGAGNDYINAGDGRNTISAGEGNNRILTGKGNDVVFAGAGNDVIYTGAGNDTIYAGNGNNIINAGNGNDRVYLGSGTDQIILGSGQGSVTVVGFNASGDKLRLGGSLAVKSLNFVTQGSDTLVKAGGDLLATLKDAAVTARSLVTNGAPLFRYEVVDLGALSPNTNDVRANAINDFGQITGRSGTGTNITFIGTNGVETTRPVNQAFIWENGAMKPLTSTGVKKGGSSEDGQTVTQYGAGGGFASGINDLGVVVGTSDQKPGPTDRGLLWQKSGDYKLDIYDFGGVESYFFDVNNQGQIAGRHIYGPGSTATSPTRSNAIFWENGVKIDLSSLGGDTNTARSINNKGQIVGQIDGDGLLNDKTVNSAALWQRGANGEYTLTDLGTFGADQSIARDINEAGQIIGWTVNGTGSSTVNSAFLLQDGELINLGGFGGRLGETAGINEFAEVVGYSQNVAGQDLAYVWNDGMMVDLNNAVTTKLTFNGSTVTLTRATDINNFGDITAYGTYTYKDEAGVTQTGTRSYLLKAVV